jgi:brefeldin A-resistance guanine nucleotide exchange factor 1
MHSLVRSVFSRLHTVDPAVEEEKLRVNEDEGEEGDIRMTVTTDGSPTEPTSTPEMSRESASEMTTAAPPTPIGPEPTTETRRSEC